jgi:hypothetical protein
VLATRAVADGDRPRVRVGLRRRPVLRHGVLYVCAGGGDGIRMWRLRHHVGDDLRDPHGVPRVLQLPIARIAKARHLGIGARRGLGHALIGGLEERELLRRIRGQPVRPGAAGGHHLGLRLLGATGGQKQRNDGEHDPHLSVVADVVRSSKLPPDMPRHATLEVGAPRKPGHDVTGSLYGESARPSLVFRRHAERV